MNSSGSGILRLAAREILDGDRLKFQAKSCLNGSGGGARDMRFSPYVKFDDVFGRILPNRAIVSRKRGGVPTPTTVYTASVSVRNPGGSHDTQVIFEPPNDYRDFEGRVALIHQLGLDIPASTGKRLLFLLGQMDDGTAFVTTAREEDVPHWHPDVAALLDKMLLYQHPRNAANGYIDFVTGRSHARA